MRNQKQKEIQIAVLRAHQLDDDSENVGFLYREANSNFCLVQSVMTLMHGSKPGNSVFSGFQPVKNFQMRLQRKEASRNF